MVSNIWKILYKSKLMVMEKSAWNVGKKKKCDSLVNYENGK